MQAFCHKWTCWLLTVTTFEQLQVAIQKSAKKLKHMASFMPAWLWEPVNVKESKIFYQVDFNQLDLEAIYQVLAFVAKYPKTQVEFWSI